MLEEIGTQITVTVIATTILTTISTIHLIILVQHIHHSMDQQNDQLFQHVEHLAIFHLHQVSVIAFVELLNFTSRNVNLDDWFLTVGIENNTSPHSVNPTHPTHPTHPTNPTNPHYGPYNNNHHNYDSRNDRNNPSANSGSLNQNFNNSGASAFRPFPSKLKMKNI